RASNPPTATPAKEVSTPKPEKSRPAAEEDLPIARHASATSNTSNIWIPASFWMSLACSQLAASQQIPALASNRAASASAVLCRKEGQERPGSKGLIWSSTCIERFSPRIIRAIAAETQLLETHD